MARIAEPRDYWIAPEAIFITRNALGDPDRIQGNVASGAAILCYIKGVTGLEYDNGHNYKSWPLTLSPTYFNTTTKKYVYAAIPKNTQVGSQAVIVFPSHNLDIYGQTEQGEQIGSTDYYYIWLQGILSASVDDSGATQEREWLQEIQTGLLSSDEALSTLDTDWYTYSQLTSTVSFLKKITMKASAWFSNLIIGEGTTGGELKGVATNLNATSIAETSTEHIVTPSFIENFVSKRFLSKVNKDSAAGHITLSAGVNVGQFVQGETGASVDANGNAEVESMNVRGDLDVSGSATMDSADVATIANVGEGMTVGTGDDSVYITPASVEVGTFQADTSGAKIWLDGNKASHIELDYLTVRRAAMFREITIKELKHIGGELALTPAAEKCVKVEYLTSGGVVTTDYTKANVFRCYFDAKDADGNAITNDFIVGDLVRCQKFDLENATNGYKSTKYYWRRVTGVGTSGDYHYINLSNASGGYDAAAGLAGVPAAGDNMVQLGCRNNAYPNRQSAIILSAVASDAPSTKYYQGIVTFSLADCLVKDEGYDSQTGLFHTYTYGESYVGAADQSSFMKFTPDRGVEIRMGGTDLQATLDSFNARVGGNTTGNLYELPSAATSSGYKEVIFQKTVYLTKGVEYTINGIGVFVDAADSIIISVLSGQTAKISITLNSTNSIKHQTYVADTTGWHVLQAVAYSSSGQNVVLQRASLEQPSVSAQSYFEMQADHISLGVEGISNGNLLEETDWRGRHFKITYNDRGDWSGDVSYVRFDKVTYWGQGWVLLGAESVDAGQDDPYHWDESTSGKNPWVGLSEIETGEELTKWNWTGDGYCVWMVPNAYKRMTAAHLKKNGSVTTQIRQVTTGKLSPNETYTLSLYYRSLTTIHLNMQNIINTSGSLTDDEGLTGVAIINGHATALNGTEKRSGIVLQANPILPNTNWGWQFVSITFITKSSGNSPFCIDAYSANAEAEVTMIKIEKGSVATPWTDLPDVLQRTGIDIEQGKIVATANKFEVRNNAGDKTFSIDEQGNIQGEGNAAFKGKVVAEGFEAWNDDGEQVFGIDSAGNGFMKGVVRATTFYTSQNRINLQANMSATDLLNACDGKLPNVLMIYSTSTNRDSALELYVELPRAVDYPGHELEIFCQALCYQQRKSYQDHYPKIKITTYNDEGFQDIMWSSNHGAKNWHPDNAAADASIWPRPLFYVRLVSMTIEGNTRWTTFDWKNCTQEIW